MMVEKEDFLLIHALIYDDCECRYIDRDSDDDLSYRMNTRVYEYYTDTKPIIYGHWAAEGLRIDYNSI